MKPLKGAQSLANWLLRLAILLYFVLGFWGTLFKFDFTDLNYILIFVLALFSVLLFIGGFLRKHSLTVWSGLIILIVSVVEMILMYLNTKSFGGDVLVFILPAAIGLFFIAKGNNN